MAHKATAKPTVALANATLDLSPEGISLLNAEVETRQAWYATHDTGTPRKPYTPAQHAALRALEKAKAAFVAHVGAANFKDAARLAGYSPQYAPRVRPVTAA